MEHIRAGLTVPTLLLDEEKCRANIHRMVRKARQAGVRLRPHFKTHQSWEVGRWFREAGVTAITVSSLRMASYFAADGWSDITVAFPVNIREMARIRDLVQQVELNVLVEDLETVHQLDTQLNGPLGIWLKIDAGYHRTGLQPDNLSLIQEILSAIRSSWHLKAKGILAHAGNSYGARGQAEIAQVHQETLAVMQRLRSDLQPSWPDLEVSVGDTPTCSVMEQFPGVDEIRPGNFVFYDATQLAIGSCVPDWVAVALACPVVAVHPWKQEILLYGGGVHFSKDRLPTPAGDCYGYLLDWTAEGWAWPAGTPSPVVSLSQEHGRLAATPELLARVRPGDILPIMPVHSCMTADLLKQYVTLEGKVIDMMHYV
ncbi:MAG: alanine racemase [Lewinellaceae bacterium]|nr:alanine racemase [Lewinellaceae bacterium]